MKITVQNKMDHELEVIVVCPKIDDKVDRIVSLLNSLDQQIIVKENGETVILSSSDLFYVDSVDKTTFVYTKDKVYECSMKLYELEDQYEFFRASKSCVINVRHIKSLKSEMSRRIRVTMDNDEQIIVSRQYADKLKKKLGVK